MVDYGGVTQAVPVHAVRHDSGRQERQASALCRQVWACPPRGKTPPPRSRRLLAAASPPPPRRRRLAAALPPPLT